MRPPRPSPFCSLLAPFTLFISAVCMYRSCIIQVILLQTASTHAIIYALDRSDWKLLDGDE